MARLRTGLLFAVALAACASDPVQSSIAGVVIDPLSEAPIAGVRVRARDVPGEALTDARGRFELPVPPGAHDLLFDREGHVAGRHAGAPAGAPVEAHLFPLAPSDADVARYFAGQPVRRHAHPAHERPPPLVEGDVGRSVLAGTAPDLPETIRVWRSGGTPLQPTAANGWADRSCDPAAVVIELPREEYVKGVIPHEWFPSWHPEALRAGAIAARTYAVNWSARGGRWDCADVDDGTVTQVYRDDRAATTDEAVDATAGVVVVRSGMLISTEYSAENADPTEFGVDEPTCTGTTRHGHGRGMCQWGTHRWASGICANPPCDFGAFGSDGKDHRWMVEHYYPGATIVGGRPAAPCQVLGPEGGVLDDDGPCFRAYGPAAYWRTEAVGWDGSLRWTNAFEAASPSNWARWEIALSTPGSYRVEVYVDGDFGVWERTRYRVTHALGEDVVVIDQGAADGWVELGAFDFEASGRVVVEDDYEGPVPMDQHIVADAVRITPVGSTASDAGAGLDGGAAGARVGEGPREASPRLTGCAVGRGEAGAAIVIAGALAWLLARRRRRA